MIERLYARGLPAGDSDALWIGCAGRLGAGLRTGLLFDDLARLGRLLDDPLHAVRLVCSGAADPDDADGQAQLAKLAELSHDPRFEGRIVFVPDWGLEVAHILVEGVDLWLGTATRGRPCESWGVRAAANGGLNLSIAEGWWREVAGQDELLGWTLGGERMFDEQAAQDAADSRMLFALLEKEIVPSFYDWDGEAIPQRWVERVRASMRTIPAAFDRQL
jgi:starch phosphorylase